MNTTLRQQLHHRIITIVHCARPLVGAIDRKDRDLARQLKRSLNSIALNVAEGFGAHAGNARLSFRRALGELYESQATLEVAAAWGYVTVEQASAVVSELAVWAGACTGCRGDSALFIPLARGSIPFLLLRALCVLCGGPHDSLCVGARGELARPGCAVLVPKKICGYLRALK